MGSRKVSGKGDVVAAIGYLPLAAILVYLWGKSYNRRFHGYQGVALLAYGIVALLMTDIVCALIGVPSALWLAVVTAIYLCCTVVFAIFAFAGINIDMKIYKSPVDEEI
jgi:hypothetical protein